MPTILCARAHVLLCMATWNVFAEFAQAVPQVALPFNSQVPTVARVDKLYSFQLSSSTFASNIENLTYSVADQPPWLTIDSATRMLSGIPRIADIGSSNFILTAADSTGVCSMQCTLVVSNAPAPKLKEIITQQIASTVDLSSSSPVVVNLPPSKAFKFDFQRNSFIDVVQRKLYYYATLTDHTPLPSWLSFDDTAVTLSGVVPYLSAVPQNWSVDIISSDVKGFAGTTTSFTIAIGTQQLAFVPAQQDWKLVAGTNVSFTALGHQLCRNGEQMKLEDLESASANIPDWLIFDSQKLTISGVVPQDISHQNVTVSAKDREGNTATAVIHLVPGNSSLFEGQVGSISAQAGKPFSYHLDDSLFSEPNVNLSIRTSGDVQWLHFEPASRILNGTIPSATKSEAVRATLVATEVNGGESQSQVFTIIVKGVGLENGGTNAVSTSDPAARVPASTSSSGAGSAIEQRSSGMSSGAIAAIVVLSIVASSLILLCLIRFCRNKRRESGVERRWGNPEKSKPLHPPPVQDQGDTSNIVTRELKHDVENGAETSVAAQSEAPQTVKVIDEAPPHIHLTLPSHSVNRESKCNRISRVSQASSLGSGEDTIRADYNIPELGYDAATLHTPHENFAIPADMSRISRRLSQTSSANRALRRSKDQHGSGNIVSLGVSAVGLVRHASNRTGKCRRGRSSSGRLSITREASSTASLSTRGTSVLSTRPSEFPLPPSTHSMSLSLPTLSISKASLKRKSIRLVERSDSAATDNRPISDRRQSFIRNRASVRVQSPLFANGSRASAIDTRQIGNGHVHCSNPGSAPWTRIAKREVNMSKTHSESSSLEPRLSDQRGRQARESPRSSQKLWASFPPDYARAVSEQQTYEDEGSGGDSSWISESMNSEDFIRAEMAKPRHERSFVLPGEASPTPPPALPSSLPSSQHPRSSIHSVASAEAGATRQEWRQRLRDRSSSPLRSQAQLANVSIPSVTRTNSAHVSQLGEPIINFVSVDSLHKGRSRMIQTTPKRPASVHEAHRSRSMKAEQDMITTGGGEQMDDIDTDDEMEPAGSVVRARVVVPSVRSDLSEPAFL